MAGQIDQAATWRDGSQVRGVLRHARAIHAPSWAERHLVEAVGKVTALAADTSMRGKRRAG